MSEHRALLAGQAMELIRSIPGLLSRAGVAVDVVATDWRLRGAPGIRRFTYARNGEALLDALQRRTDEDYQLVVLGDDITLRMVRDADLSDAVKLKLLPVTGSEHFSHLTSKIGLANALGESSVPIPRYCVAHQTDELVPRCDEVGYPLLIKVDWSAAGEGVHECTSPSDAAAVAALGLRMPLLIQEKIVGEMVDVSGFFGDGELVHMGYARCDALVSGPFSPSSVRTYTQLSDVDPEVILEVRELGRVLGINGFANISCIRATADGKHYFFECDVRPTAWMGFTRYIGDDPVGALRQYFRDGTTLALPRVRNAAFPVQRVVPYPFRLTLLEILRNRYGVWRFLRGISVAEICYRFLPRHPFSPLERAVVRVLKRTISEKRYAAGVARYRAMKARVR